MYLRFSSFMSLPPFIYLYTYIFCLFKKRVLCSVDWLCSLGWLWSTDHGHRPSHPALAHFLKIAHKLCMWIIETNLPKCLIMRMFFPTLDLSVPFLRSSYGCCSVLFACASVLLQVPSRSCTSPQGATHLQCTWSFLAEYHI